MTKTKRNPVCEFVVYIDDINNLSLKYDLYEGDNLIGKYNALFLFNF